MSSLKEEIANYYESNDEQDMFNIRDNLISFLLDNGLKVEDIDKLVTSILKRSDRVKFKYYLLNKHDYNVKCGICGIKENLELHHLKRVYKYPELEFDEDNVCFLCHICHRLVHHGKGDDLKDKAKVKSIFKQELARNRDKNNKNSNVLSKLMVYFF